MFEDGSPPAKRSVLVGARRGLREEVRRRVRLKLSGEREFLMRSSDGLGRRSLVIALIGPGVYPYRTGGIEVALYHLAKRLAKKHYVLVLSAISEQKERMTIREFGKATLILVKALGRFKGALSSLPLVLLAPIVLLAKKPDVINAHQALSPMVAATLAALLTRRPLVITCHASDVRVLRRNRAVRAIQALCFRLADVVVGVSGEMKAILMQDYGLKPEKVIIIPNGYDEEFVKIAPRGREADVAFLGSLRSAKDPMTLMRALEMLAEEGTPVKAAIIGDGPLRPELERFCEEHGLSGLVAFHGHLPHHEALFVLASAKIFVLPSVREGLPLALVEAMALGKPVVATPVGAIPELVRDGWNGLLVRPGDAEGLASAIRRLLRDEGLLKLMGERARKSVERLSWTEICRRYEGIYYALLKDRHPY